MPSATLKAEPVSASENSDPLHKLGLAIEKRVRNLEKRKTKLENYKSDLEGGKKLNADQQRAVDAYEAVQGSIEICHEFTAIVESLMEEHAKDLKLQQKKQQDERNVQELERVKQILKFQAVFSKLGEESVRQDFISGSNGAFRLTDKKLLALEEAEKLVCPLPNDERESIFSNLKTGEIPAAEHLISLVDGKNRPMIPGGPSYKDMRTLLNQISNCSYPKRSKKSSPSESKNPSPTERSPTKTQNLPEHSKKDLNKTHAAKMPKCEVQLETTPVENSPRPKTEVCPTPSEAPTSVVNSDVPSPPLVVHSDPSSAERLTLQQPRAPAAPSTSMFTGRTEGIDFGDLMASPATGLNFLQDSQVAASAVYVDPAVVSFGSVKPDGLVQMHEEQQRRLGVAVSQSRVASQIIDSAVVSSEVPSTAPIRSETFVNSTFSSFNPSQQQGLQTITNALPPQVQYQRPTSNSIGNQPSSNAVLPPSTTSLHSKQPNKPDNSSNAPAPLNSFSQDHPRRSFPYPASVDAPSLAAQPPPPPPVANKPQGRGGRVTGSWASEGEEEEEEETWGRAPNPNPHSTSVVTGSWDEFCAQSADSGRHSKIHSASFESSATGGADGDFNNRQGMGNHGGFRSRLREGGFPGSNFSSQRGGRNNFSSSNFAGGNRMGSGYRGGGNRGLTNGGGSSFYRGGRGGGYTNRGSRGGGSENGGRNGSGAFRGGRSPAYNNQSASRNAY